MTVFIHRTDAFSRRERERERERRREHSVPVQREREREREFEIRLCSVRERERERERALPATRCYHEMYLARDIIINHPRGADRLIDDDPD